MQTWHAQSVHLLSVNTRSIVLASWVAQCAQATVVARQQVSGPTRLITGFDHILHHGTRTLSASLWCHNPVPVIDAAVSSSGARRALSLPLHDVMSLMSVTRRKVRNVMIFVVVNLEKKRRRTILTPIRALRRTDPRASLTVPYVVWRPSYIKSSKPTEPAMIGAPRSW